jgi:hypothetical protein
MIHLATPIHVFQPGLNPDGSTRLGRWTIDTMLTDPADRQQASAALWANAPLTFTFFIISAPGPRFKGEAYVIHLQEDGHLIARGMSKPERL